MDVQGREVFKRITNQAETTIYLDNFDAGVYSVRLLDEAGRQLQVEKVVIQE